jgi:hypothetical protein
LGGVKHLLLLTHVYTPAQEIGIAKCWGAKLLLPRSYT